MTNKTKHTEAEIGWSAAAIKFDGSIGVYTQGQKSSNYSLIARVVNTNMLPLRKFKSLWGGHIHHYQSSKKHAKLSHQWSLRGKKAGKFLMCILPMMTSKCRQTKIGIAFAKTVGSRGRPTTDVIKAERQKMHNKMKKLNKRGRK